MEHNDKLQKATQHLQLLLLRTPGKRSQDASAEAEAIAQLAFAEANPVRELFVAAASCKPENGWQFPKHLDLHISILTTR